MLPPKHEGRQRKVLLTSALNGKGITESWEEIIAHFSFMRKRGILDARRQEQLSTLLEGLVEEELKKQFMADPGVAKRKKRDRGRRAFPLAQPLQRCDPTRQILY